MRNTGTMLLYERLIEQDPEFRARRQSSELEALRTERNSASALPSAVKSIQVVVHVVYHPGYLRTNISKPQVDSQIAALNEAFGMTNADVGTIPASFSGDAADTGIQFQLATLNPNGDATSGITWTASNRGQFTTLDRSVMSAASGGADPWPADRYLNIWVCGRLVGPDGISQSGYATFPGMSPGPDGVVREGVVIAHWAFGTLGTAEEPFHLGRTTVHEVGHWLNLHHIWGDREECGPADDYVADTPNQEGPNFDFPVFPHVSCGNTPDGDMFVNYMDYTDDACMRMFTKGQALRMQTSLSFDRPTI